MTSYGLPAGISLQFMVATIVAMGLVNLALRVLPFFFGRYFSGNIMQMLGLTMPVGVMVVLTVYTVSSAQLVPALLALAVTIGLHLWRKSPALSILLGTAVYVVLVNLVW